MMEIMGKGLTVPNAPKFLQLFLPIGLKVLDIVEKRLHRGSIVHAWANSKDSSIRPGRFKLLECEKKIVLVVQKIQTRTFNKDSKQVKTFSEMVQYWLFNRDF